MNKASVIVARWSFWVYIGAIFTTLLTIIATYFIGDFSVSVSDSIWPIQLLFGLILMMLYSAMLLFIASIMLGKRGK